MHVTDSDLKAEFAKNNHNPKEADYIQYGVGFSVDGSQEYEWTSYTDDDWNTLYGLESGWDSWYEHPDGSQTGTPESEDAYSDFTGDYWSDWDQWSMFDSWEDEWDESLEGSETHDDEQHLAIQQRC